MKRMILLMAIVTILLFTIPVWSNITSVSLNNILSIEQQQPNFNNTYSTSEDYVIGEVRMEEHGSSTYLGNNRWIYKASVGETNAWNGTDFVRYIYDQDNKQVTIGKLTFTHETNGVIAISHHGDAIGKLKWYVQYYLSNVWQNFTFTNYQFVGVTKTDISVAITQRWWAASGELNVTYTYNYFNELKMQAKATSFAAQSLPVRVIWALTEIAVAPEYTVLSDNGIPVGVELGNGQQIFWYDVRKNTPDIAINTVLDSVNRRAGVVFGNRSSILSQYETMDIDPTYTLNTDYDDAYYNDPYGTPAIVTNGQHVYFSNDTGSTASRGYIAVVLTIPQASTINSANFSGYERTDNSTMTHYMYRVDETSVGYMEGDTTAPATLDTSSATTWESNGVANEWSPAINITDIVQEQVNLQYWCSGYGIGFGFQTQTNSTNGVFSFEDFTYAGTANLAYITVDYTDSEIHQYKLAADIDDTYWSWLGTTWDNVITSNVVYTTNQTDAIYLGSQRIALTIPQYSIINSAFFFSYETSDALTGYISVIRRIDETNVGSLEGDTSRPIAANTSTATFTWDSVEPEWTNITVTDLVDEQVNLDDWASGYYIGLQWWSLNKTSSVFQMEDYNSIERHDAFITVDYTIVNVPTNNGVTLTDATDTDNMYANYTTYTVTANVSDADGFPDLDYVNISVWDDTRVTEYWAMSFDEDTGVFSEHDGGGYILLVTASCSNVSSVNNLNMTFAVQVDWDHPDVSDIDVKIIMWDDSPKSKTEFSEEDWDIETRLDYSVAPTVDDNTGTTIDRGNLDGTFYVSGTLIYYGSTDNYPLTAGVDVYVSMDAYGTNVGPWNDTALTSGVFNITCYADDIVALTTVTIKPVVEAAGSAGASIYYTTDVTDTYIADQLIITVTITDQRININTNISLAVTAIYDYDDASYDGTFTLNDTAEAKATASRFGYTVTSADGDDTHGITTIGTNDADYCIWDSLNITAVDPTDQRISISTNASGMVFSAIYNYDSTAYDGTFTLNDTTYNHAVVGIYGYTVSTANGDDTYGITAILDNDETYCIFDQLKVLGYISNSTDNHDNINTWVNITVWIQYDYDDANVTDGTITVSSESFVYDSWLSGGGNWTLNVTRAAHETLVFNTVVAAGNTYGITSVNQNSQTITYIWDSLTISIIGPTDQRGNLNANASGIVASATYDEGGAYAGTLTFNATDWDGDGTVVRWGWTIASAAGDDTYGITAISINDVTYMIWDSLTIVITVTDNRININANISLTVTATYDYDNAAYAGTFTMNDTLEAKATAGRFNYSCTADGNDAYGITTIGTDDSDYCIWDSLTITISITDQRINVGENLSMTVTAVYDYDSSAYDGTFTLNDTLATEGLAVRNGYTVSSADGDDTYGITAIGTNDADYCIWDSLAITITVTDHRININTNISISVVAVYAYDSAPFDGTFTCNDTLAAKAVASRYGYSFTPDGDDTYDITSVSLDDSDYCIWDSLTVTIVVTDQRININTNLTISVSAIYDYDNAAYSGTFTANDTLEAKATAARFGYSFTADGDDAYGITVIGTDDSDYCIWDSLTVTAAGPTDQRINISANASGMAFAATYDYDSAAYDGSLTLNDTTYDHGVVGIYGYTVASAAGDDTYGITAISTNAVTYCIFDQVIVLGYLTNSTDNRDDISTYFNITFWIQYDYDNTNVTDGTVTLDGLATTYLADGNWSVCVTSALVAGTTYETVAASGNTYGITSVNENAQSQLVIWDRILITITADAETPANDIAVTFTLSVTYDYDDAACTTYSLLITRELVNWYWFTSANVTLFTDTASGVGYSYTAASGSETTYSLSAISSNSLDIIWAAVTTNPEGPGHHTEPVDTGIFRITTGFTIVLLTAFVVIMIPFAWGSIRDRRADDSSPYIMSGMRSRVRRATGGFAHVIANASEPSDGFFGFLKRRSKQNNSPYVIGGANGKIRSAQKPIRKVKKVLETDDGFLGWKKIPKVLGIVSEASNIPVADMINEVNRARLFDNKRTTEDSIEERRKLREKEKKEREKRLEKIQKERKKLAEQQSKSNKKRQNMKRHN